MSPETIQEYVGQVPEWSVKDGLSLERSYQFSDFKEALEFLNSVGSVAEREGHHPDMLLHGWNKIALTLSTHAIGGLSLNDFILAAKIDSLGKN